MHGPWGSPPPPPPTTPSVAFGEFALCFTYNLLRSAGAHLHAGLSCAPSVPAPAGTTDDGGLQGRLMGGLAMALRHAHNDRLCAFAACSVQRAARERGGGEAAKCSVCTCVQTAVHTRRSWATDISPTMLLSTGLARATSGSG